jgi:predicted PurR-regulated permease PerM
MARTDSEVWLSRFVGVKFALIAIGVLYFARVVFIPFVLAVLFTFLLTPIVRLFDRIRVPRLLSSVTVVAFCVLILGLLSWVIARQLVDVADDLPS